MPRTATSAATAPTDVGWAEYVLHDGRALDRFGSLRETASEHGDQFRRVTHPAGAPPEACNVTNPRHAMAIAGMVMGYVVIGLAAVTIIVVAVIVAAGT